MISAFFPCFWTDYPPDICNTRLTNTLGRDHFQPCERKQVVRYDGAAHVPFESRPARPGTPGESEGSLENRDAGFDAGAEVPELLVDPGALNHVQYRDSFALGEGNIGDPFPLGFSQVVVGGKATIGGHLRRRPLQLRTGRRKLTEPC